MKNMPLEQKEQKRFVVCKTDALPSGERLLIELGGKKIGVFNVAGKYHALLNYCPHQGAPLCLGPITGTTLPTDKYEFIYGHEGAILRCAWHGWEFDIRTGDYLVKPNIRVRTYKVEIEQNEVVIYI
ncbi:Rieske (2Fe-2S) protein [Plectonema radiosum NIES-515]|uniref:Rieske (2Fe-2S) protein n=1 Tax=Plectonema radiosum NIES-515 TaxID=2986073 RepID=A0ABT3B7W1_9CYAN|nr:Rieske (2Fe-2S) protein [Plectonema radiosum]MCV3216969.1 Rieske (2Fe-2S) protein [Plectonema radiosum NIES-515]